MTTKIRSSALAADAKEPRAARSHSAMADALVILLQSKQLSDITVSELCDKAGVHRTTFYGHYRDLFAFAADVCADLLEDLFATSMAGPEAVPRMLRHILDRRPEYQLVFGRIDVGFRQSLRERTIAILRDQSPDDLTASFLAGGLLSVLEDWTTSDSDDIDGYTASIRRAFAGITTGQTPAAA